MAYDPFCNLSETVTQSACLTSSSNFAVNTASSSAETSGPLSSSSVWLPSSEQVERPPHGSMATKSLSGLLHTIRTLSHY